MPMQRYRLRHDVTRSVEGARFMGAMTIPGDSVVVGFDNGDGTVTVVPQGREHEPGITVNEREVELIHASP